MKAATLLKPLLFASIVIAPFYFTPRLIKVRTMQCSNQYGSCSEDLTDKLEGAIGMGGSLYDKRSSVSQVLENELLVSDYSLQFKLPSTLQIKLVERKATFAIGSINGPKGLVDVQGYVIAITDDTKLPLLQIDDLPPDVGEKVSQRSLFALNILINTYSNYGVVLARLDTDSLLIELSRGLEVIFPLEGDKGVLMGSLALILAEIDKKNSSEEFDGTKISTIDLRFKNPIVK